MKSLWIIRLYTSEKMLKTVGFSYYFFCCKFFFADFHTINHIYTYFGLIIAPNINKAEQP